MQEAIDGLGGLDVIISNAVGSTIHLFTPGDGEDCNAMSWPRLMDKGLDKIYGLRGSRRSQ